MLGMGGTFNVCERQTAAKPPPRHTAAKEWQLQCHTLRRGLCAEQAGCVRPPPRDATPPMNGRVAIMLPTLIALELGGWQQRQASSSTRPGMWCLQAGSGSGRAHSSPTWRLPLPVAPGMLAAPRS
jgi:hypothetical protein